MFVYTHIMVINYWRMKCRTLWILGACTYNGKLQRSMCLIKLIVCAYISDGGSTDAQKLKPRPHRYKLCCIRDTGVLRENFVLIAKRDV